VHELGFAAYQGQEFKGVEFGNAALAARGIECALEQVGVVDARNLDRY